MSKSLHPLGRVFRRISTLEVCIPAKWPISPALISGFSSMKRLGVFLLPPGWDASPSRGYPQHQILRYTFIHLGGERHCESEVSSPRTQHNVPGQGLTQTARSGDERANFKAITPPTPTWCCRFFRHFFVELYFMSSPGPSLMRNLQFHKFPWSQPNIYMIYMFLIKRKPLLKYGSSLIRRRTLNLGCRSVLQV